MSAENDGKPRVILIGGGASLRAAIAREIMAMAVIAEQAAITQSRPVPPKFDVIDIRPEPIRVLPANNVKQLRREQRAREKRMRKMIPKGRK